MNPIKVINLVGPVPKIYQKQRDLRVEYDYCLEEEWLHGYFYTLVWKTDRSIQVRIFSKLSKKSKPYQVSWSVSGDKMVNGKVKTVNYIKTRSFLHPENMVKFIEENLV